MSRFSIEQIFLSFAQSLDLPIHADQHQQTVSYVDMETAELDQGYLRLCIDTVDDVIIVETGMALRSVFSSGDQVLQKLMGLQMMASSVKGGKRFFPSIDAKNEHLILSHILGTEAVHNESDLEAVIDACAREVAALRKNLHNILQQTRSKPAASTKTARPASMTGHRPDWAMKRQVG
jgi:hypothetical protein